jgi:NAD(P)-dependent dehydrogenase (short-subunit alcohol dehydrogenase family)
VSPASEDRVALVTGAASGVGRAVATRFAAEGMQVVGVDVTPPDRIPVDADAPPVRNLQGDVRRIDDLRAAVEVCRRDYGRLDVVAPVAGLLRTGLVLDMDHEERDAVLDINLKGVWNTIQAALPLVATSPGPRRIVVCGSLTAVVGAPRQGAYVASKHALVGLVKAVALECAADGITVNMVSPAGVDTALLRAALSAEQVAEFEATTPVGRLSQPDEVAGCFVFLAGREAAYMTGENMVVDGGCKAVNVHNVAQLGRPLPLHGPE